MDSPLMRYRLPIITLLFVVAALLAGTFFYTAVPQVKTQIDDVVYGVQVGRKANWSGLKGSIVVTLQKSEPRAQHEAYRIKLGGSAFDRISSEGSPLTPRYSPDEKYVAYSVYVDDIVQLIVAPNTAKKEESITISSSKMKMAHLPSWSLDSEQIAFTAQTGYENGTSDVDAWGVYVADPFLTASARFVSTGMYPVFALDGSLLIVKSDGLHRFVYEQGTWKGELVLALKGGSAVANMQLDISADRAMLAWTNPEHGTLDIFTLTSRKGELEIIKTDEFPISGFWPVFSPDKKYVALETVESIEVPVGQRLTVLDLATGESVVIADLAHYIRDSIIITDWVVGEAHIDCDCVSSSTPTIAGIANTKSKGGAGVIEYIGLFRPPQRVLTDPDGVFTYAPHTFTASPLRTERGGEVVLGWNTGNRDLCMIRSTDGHSIPKTSLLSFEHISWLLNPFEKTGYLPRNGTASVKIRKETTFTLRCDDPGKVGNEIGAIAHPLLVHTLPSR